MRKVKSFLIVLMTTGTIVANAASISGPACVSEFDLNINYTCNGASGLGYTANYFDWHAPSNGYFGSKTTPSQTTTTTTKS